MIGHENPESAVVLTPPPPTGFGADDAALASLAGLARAGDEVRLDVWRTRLVCERLTVTPQVECGRDPMQEPPPLLVAIIERFLVRRREDA